MAITGTHMLLYSSDADVLRAVLRDVFKLKSVDACQGWLIFKLPPAELGIHPAEIPTTDSGARHQITFMCDDIRTTVSELSAKGVSIEEDLKDQGWGISVTMRLPGDVAVMLYQPRHPTAI